MDNRRGLLSFAVLLAIGCGRAPDRVRVTGQVVFEDGQSVDHGMIEFAPLASQSGVSAGTVILQGRYEIPPAKGLRRGEYRVRIFQSKQVISEAGPPGSSRPYRPAEQIAAQFNMASELIAEIASLRDHQIDY